MTDNIDPKAAELTERLRALGSQPVDPPLASAHLSAMAAVRPVGRLRQRLAVAGALFAGTVIGSTGLAAAGALPRTVQDAASAALAKVDISVPVGTERYDGPECVGDTAARNRGQYLKQERAKGKEAFAAAKATKCGMPLSALNGDDDEGEQQAASTTTASTTSTTTASAQGTGKPEEPGKSVCVDRGQGNSGGLGKDNKPEEPGQPSDPGKPASAGKPDDTGKPDETGKPACTEPTPAGQTDQAPAKADDDTDDDADDTGNGGNGKGKPATVPPAGGNGSPTTSSVRPS